MNNFCEAYLKKRKEEKGCTLVSSTNTANTKKEGSQFHNKWKITIKKDKPGQIFQVVLQLVLFLQK